MKLRSISTAAALLGLLAVSPGCKDFYDVNVDPLHPSSASEAQLLPGTQVAMATYLGFSLEGMGQATSTLVGQLNSGRGIGTFQQNGGSFSNQWNGLYADMLENNEIIIRQAAAARPVNRTFLGIAQLQKAYVFSIMTDLWGNIPYSQALLGDGNRAPRYDDSRDIYLGNSEQGIQSLFDLINEGIANVTAGGGTSPGAADLIYGGTGNRWAAFGNTLKLKLYNQMREYQDSKGDARIVHLADSVRALLNKPMLEAADGDFELAYGSSIQPENRNISFLSNYVSPNREDFVNQDFYQYMIIRRDPRINYYFYNQSNSTTGGDTNIPESGAAAVVPKVTNSFITVRLGSSGTGASVAADDIITLPGLYPGGGRYNDGVQGPADFTYGRGTTAQRFLTSFNRYFTEAELRLMVLNDATGAAAAYEKGVRNAFAKVAEVVVADGGTTTTTAKGGGNTIPDIVTFLPAYLTAANTRFTGATNNDRKLNAIMQEKYVASFGFGEDIWTDFRRTGYPDPTSTTNAANGYGQITRPPGEVANTVSSGPRPTVLYYDLNDLTLNPNAPAQHTGLDAARGPFWLRNN